MISTITLDTYKQQISSGDAFNLSDSFNGRVGDEQVPLVVHFKERGLAQQFQDGLVPFLTGFVGSLDENDQVTAETGEAVSYVGTSDDIVGLGRVKMNLPGTMFPQEGYFYGFLGLQTGDGSKRITTFNVWFHVYNGNPDMFVNKAPFRTELQKLLDGSEQLISKTDGVIQAKLIEWQNAINKLITDGNADLDAYKQRVSLAEDQLTALAAKIQAGGLFTQADFDAAIQPLENLLVGKVNVDESLDIGGKLSRSWATQVDDFIAKLPVGGFKMAIISDSHYENLYDESSVYSYQLTADAYKHLGAFNRLGNAVDVMVANGDNVNGLDANVPHTIADGSVYATKLLQTAMKADKYVMLGNHDDNSPQLRLGNIYPSDTIIDAKFKEMYQTEDLINGENRSDGSLYFYKDYTDAKIRLIGLNSFDVPETPVNDDGTVKFPRYLISTYSQDQINWLANVALKNIPDGYQIAVVTHAPLPYGYSPSSEVKMYNQTVIKGLLDAVATGTSYSGKSDTGTPEECQVSIAADFSSQGARPIAGFFGGHVHKEIIKPLDHFTSCVVLADANIDQANVGTINELGVTVVTIDTVNRKVMLNGLGRATDRQFTY
ncbi:metallophosphoesterase family protein [Lactiplantibacillus plantarum]|uniref:metallophosphoesterase family protein n=1 Tax=Lactiplantibacillus plantarum TaxID=1590 RepID=UPI001C9E2FBC|nr:metallophosphoesterase [Lactiplantibacillus plantarum]